MYAQLLLAENIGYVKLNETRQPDRRRVGDAAKRVGVGKERGREGQRGMDRKAHGIITESSQRRRGRTTRTKATEAAKV